MAFLENMNFNFLDLQQEMFSEVSVSVEVKGQKISEANFGDLISSTIRTKQQQIFDLR